MPITNTESDPKPALQGPGGHENGHQKLGGTVVDGKGATQKVHLLTERNRLMVPSQLSLEDDIGSRDIASRHQPAADHVYRRDGQGCLDPRQLAVKEWG
jgi:hypothetical protein